MIAFNPNAIKVLRTSKNLSMDEFAEKAGGGLTRQHIHNWESGKTMPSLKSLLRVVNEFSVPLEIFFVRLKCYSSI